MNITTFLITFFEQLSLLGVRYAVLRNYRSLPLTLESRDLDIFIHRDDYEKVVCMLDTLSDVKVVYSYERHASVMAFLWGVHSGDGRRSLEIDFIFDFRWRGVRYFDPERLLERAIDIVTADATIRVPHPSDATAVLALSTLIAYTYIPLKYRNEVREYSAAYSGELIESLQSAIGAEAATVARVIQSTAPQLDRRQRLRLLQAARRHSGDSFSHTVVQGIKQFRRDTIAAWLRPPRLVFSFLGPDGVGKSTVIAEVAVATSGLSVDQFVRHLRMRVWLMHKRIAARGTVTDPHALQPRGTLASLAKLLGWVIGERLYWSLWRPRHPSVLLLDRFVDDVLIDARRYRMRLPEAIARLGARFAPRPTMVFVLVAPADVVLARKQELERGELADLLQRYAKHAGAGSRIVRIDCDRELTVIVNEINGYIVAAIRGHMAQSSAGRLSTIDEGSWELRS